MIAEPAGDPLPLVTADVDGDGIRDVVGGASRLFVRASTTGELGFLDEQPAAIAAGDLDGDGVAEIVFATADRSAVRVVEIAPTGELTSAPLVDGRADAIAIGNLDGNAFGDLVVLRNVGAKGSTMIVLRDVAAP